MGFIILFPKTSHLVFLNVYWCINIIRTPLSLDFFKFFLHSEENEVFSFPQLRLSRRYKGHENN